ncbi:hypothetical protein NH26_22905 [Flammeovirga pacifica]|uniref:Secretion system C-terminal sorting domain-containing protein n=2 Tax=Flammeovirga pacifica TaxID=915059 RepID=A0A1S1YTU0_FLAPC|nr:hypothetical protein NH26_22905 [Flammeovirga pacifica]
MTLGVQVIIAQNDLPVERLSGEIGDEKFENKKVIIEGNTFTVNGKLELKNCQVTIKSSTIVGEGEIKIENKEDIKTVKIKKEDFNVQNKKIEIKNANTIISSATLTTDGGSHLKFENGSLTCNNSYWVLDGHVDFQAHDSELEDSLHVYMENVSIQELSDKIHYKKNVGWEYSGGCIDPFEKEDKNMPSQNKDDIRPPGFTDCDDVDNQLHYFEGDVNANERTSLKWSMYSENGIGSYQIYTSNNLQNWELLTDIDAISSDMDEPIDYEYNDNVDRIDTVYFQLRSISTSQQISEPTALDTIQIYYGEDDLPVEMIYFNTEIYEDGVSLYWATATEINSDYFEVQYSLNNQDWEVLDQVNAAGNSQTTLEYQYDDVIRYGSIYYRLKQVDFDGKFEYFTTDKVMIENEQDLEVVIYPVPQNAGQDIKILPNNNEPYDIIVFNQVGQMVYLEDDLQNETALRTAWGRGMFIVHIIQKSQKDILKVQVK